MIDPFLFEQHFRSFSAFLERETGTPLKALQTHPYLVEHENYKALVHGAGQKRLGWQKWKLGDVGRGKILRSVIDAVEIEKGGDTPPNNLVPWNGRFGPDSRPHHQLHEALSSGDVVPFEEAFYNLYWGRVSDEASFERVKDLVGGKYSLLAYFFFLRDKTEYAPISTRAFDQALALLGFDLKTEGKATWTNYIAYNDALRGVQHALAERLGAETSLLDAHSFAWMLGRSVYKGPDSALVEGNIRRVADYTALAAKDREAIVRARIGQGVFRDRLIDYWGACAVTGCENPALLRASHVKPWRDCDVHEALDPFNGVLLSASIDAAFDAGLISFDDQGRILVSTALGASDRGAVGIHDGLSLQRIDARHLPFLRYHREVLFKPEG